MKCQRAHSDLKDAALLRRNFIFWFSHTTHSGNNCQVKMDAFWTYICFYDDMLSGRFHTLFSTTRTTSKNGSIPFVTPNLVDSYVNLQTTTHQRQGCTKSILRFALLLYPGRGLFCGHANEIIHDMKQHSQSG